MSSSGVMVAHQTSNLRVAGSSPAWSVFLILSLIKQESEILIFLQKLNNDKNDKYEILKYI